MQKTFAMLALLAMPLAHADTTMQVREYKCVQDCVGGLPTIKSVLVQSVHERGVDFLWTLGVGRSVLRIPMALDKDGTLYISVDKNLANFLRQYVDNEVNLQDKTLVFAGGMPFWQAYLAMDKTKPSVATIDARKLYFDEFVYYDDLADSLYDIQVPDTGKIDATFILTALQNYINLKRQVSFASFKTKDTGSAKYHQDGAWLLGKRLVRGVHGGLVKVESLDGQVTQALAPIARTNPIDGFLYLQGALKKPTLQKNVLGEWLGLFIESEQ